MQCPNCKQPITVIQYQDIAGERELDTQCLLCKRQVTVSEHGYNAAMSYAESLWADSFAICPVGHPLRLRKTSDNYTAECQTCEETWSASSNEGLAIELKIRRVLARLKAASSDAAALNILRSLI